MVIKKTQAAQFQVNKNHKVWDYQLSSKEIGISFQTINGVTPENGWWKNKVCLECYYVISGKGTVTIEQTKYDVESGDVIVLQQHKKHKLSGKHLKAIAITVPDWYEKQCEIVKE